MKLHFNPASPYTRKVVVVAHEAGLRDRIETVARAMTPVSPEADLNHDNPLGKIPCLVTDDGLTLYDSRVICEYLDTLHDGAPMFPDGPARWTVLRDQALGDGIMDAGVITRYERAVRPEDKQWDLWVDNQKEKFRRSLDVLEGAAGDLGARVDIGTIAIACALGYLDFRYADETWRTSRPKLAAWFETFAARPSMAATQPH